MKFDYSKKSKIIEDFQHLYSEWQLVLIDFISYGISDEMLNRVQNEIIDDIFFKKIIFISPTDSKKGKEINFI